MKFNRVVFPGESFALRYSFTGSRLVFRCVRDDVTLVEGVLSYGTTAA